MMLIFMVKPVPMDGGSAIVNAAQASCQIAAQPGCYPTNKVSQGYVDYATPIVLSRLQAASTRLAAALNTALR